MTKDHCRKKCEKETYVAILSGKQEVPAIETRASGKVTLKLKKNKLSVKGWFKCLEGKYAKDIGSHIHLGIAGRNGEVVLPLNPDLCKGDKTGVFEKCKNRFELTNEQVRLMKDRLFYINIHSEKYPSGELRGQILPKSYKYFLGNLSGLNEVPPVETVAKGTVVAELLNHNLTVSGSFDNLSSPIAFNILGGAHIHKGKKGENGPVVFILNLFPEDEDRAGIFEASRNVFALTCEEESLLMNDEMYVNIHSENYEGGELRSQLKEL